MLKIVNIIGRWAETISIAAHRRFGSRGGRGDAQAGAAYRAVQAGPAANGLKAGSG